MDQRRRSAHNAKISLKLKELMQNKTAPKNPEVVPKKPMNISKSPLQSVLNKPNRNLIVETNPSSHLKPYKAPLPHTPLENKENLMKPTSFHSRKTSMEIGLAQTKGNNSFQKPASQKSHSRISSMHENRSVANEQVYVGFNLVGPRIDSQESIRPQ